MTGVSSRMVVLGESLIDIVERDGRTSAMPGGSPLNVAVGLARLGHDTTFITEFGNDDHGELVAQHLDGSGVTTIRGSDRSSSTSTATAHLAADGSATYEFDVNWTLGQETTAKAGRNPALVHAGSLGAVLAPGRATVEAFLRSSPASTARTFDPNVRPSLLVDSESAAAFILRCAALCDVVKLSDEDAEWLFPGTALEEVVVRLATGQTSLVAITCGADDALLRAGRETIAVPAFDVEVVDTIGAGDAFMAGLIDAWTPKRRSPVTLEALIHIGTQAAACAALTVQRAGAMPPTHTEVDEFLAGR